MRINTIANSLLKGILLIPLYSEAWTVSEGVVEFPIINKTVSQASTHKGVLKRQDFVAEMVETKSEHRLIKKEDGSFF